MRRRGEKLGREAVRLRIPVGTIGRQRLLGFFSPAHYHISYATQAEQKSQGGVTL